MSKPSVFIASNVFKEIASNPKVSPNVRSAITSAWSNLESVARTDVFNGRFPGDDTLRAKVVDPEVKFVGCHLSHKIDASWLQESNVVAVSTGTMGYDHVGQVPGIIITHTPSVLQNAVADYTMALILATLRNVPELNDRVFSGSWKPGERWDLDGDLSRGLDNQVLGIVGLGEIGLELARRAKPWGVKTVYHDIQRRQDLETGLGIEYKVDIRSVFKEADVLSLHLPLNPRTFHAIDKDLLDEMKDDALLVNTARGGVLDTAALLDLLESGEKRIHVALDVHEQEPIDEITLQRFKNIKKKYPSLRFTLMPHNASADANTRGKMAIMLLEDLYWLVKSRAVNDLRECRIIPPQRQLIFQDGKIDQFRIHDYWRCA